MTTLLALYRRPDGGPDAQATFERRYTTEHLPLVAGTPGLRETRVHRVVEALGAETDLILVTAMRFDDRAALDAGLRLRCDAGRRAEPSRDRARAGDHARARDRARNGGGGFPGRGYCLNESRGAFVTVTAPRDDPASRVEVDDRRPLVRVEFPAPAPASAAPADHLPGVALVTFDRREALNALSFDLLDELAAALEALDADPACRAIVITGAGATGVRRRCRHPRARAADERIADRRRPVRRVGPARRDRPAAHRRRPRRRPRRWLRAGDDLRHDRRRARTPGSASPRSGSASCPGRAARSA